MNTQSSDFHVDPNHLRELEREAASAREVYETFLVRAKEVNQQVGLNSDNTRVISEAYPQSTPSHPNAKLLLPAAMIGGMMLGVMMAWLFHILFGTVLPPIRPSFQPAE